MMSRTAAGAIVAAALASACGGGSDAPPLSTMTFEVAAAVQSLATGPDDVYDLGGSVLNEFATLHVVHRAMPDAPFDTHPSLNRMRREVTMTSASTGSVPSWEDDYLDLSSRTMHGLVTDEGRVVSTARAPYPATARIGEGGLLFHGDEHDHAMSSLMGKVRVSWSMEAAPVADEAFFCVNSDYRDPMDMPVGMMQKDCYRIDPAGRVLGMRVTLSMPPLGTFVFE